MEQNKIIVNFRLTKHNSKIEIDMLNAQNLPQIKQAINSYHGDFIRDFGMDSFPNFDILCYLNVVLSYKNERDNTGAVVECNVDTSKIFIYDILGLANSNISGDYKKRKDVVEIFYDQYLKDIDYIEFSQSEDFNKTLIQRFEDKNQQGMFNLNRIESFDKQKFDFNIYMQCLNFLRYNNFDFQQANEYHNIILGIIKQETSLHKKSYNYGFGGGSQATEKLWIVNLVKELVNLGINEKLSVINKNELFDFCWHNYISRNSKISNINNDLVSNLIYLFTWDEWEEKFKEYDILSSIDISSDKQVLDNVFSEYNESVYVFLYSFILQPNISEKMSLRLLDIMPEVLKQNLKYENDTEYINLIKKRLELKEKISITNLYKFLGYLFSSAQGADVLNQIASHSFENLGYAFANFCYDHINTAYVRYKAKDNPFNGFKEKADYTSSFAWSEWEKFLDENAFDLNSEFYVSLLFSHVDSSWLEQNSYSNSFCSYINSSQYMGIVEKGYSVYKEKGGVSNIVDSLVDLLEKMPSRSKKHKYSRRDREGVIKRILQKDFILDNEAFSLLEYIIDEARKDNDLGDVPDILLDNEKFLNNKKAFMKLWDVFGSGHNFREKVAGITIMPEEVYNHLSQSKSDKVQNALAPKHEITFIK